MESKFHFSGQTWSVDYTCYYINDPCPSGTEDCSQTDQYSCSLDSNKCCFKKDPGRLGPDLVTPTIIWNSLSIFSCKKNQNDFLFQNYAIGINMFTDLPFLLRRTYMPFTIYSRGKNTLRTLWNGWCFYLFSKLLSGGRGFK